MTGPDTSKPSTEANPAGAVGDGSDTSPAEGGGVTTATHAPAYSDDTASQPYGLSGTGSTESGTSGTSNNSRWTGSPYEPLPSGDAGTDYTSSFGYSDNTYSSGPPAEPTVYAAAPADRSHASAPAPPPLLLPVFRPEDGTFPSSARQTKSRTVAGLVSAVLGTLMVAGGLYLIGEFGFRIYDAMLNTGVQPGVWDIVWTATGAGLLFAAVLLNGWSPWATALPGLALTGVGVWSIVSFDGADRVATTVNTVFARPEMVVWGITGWTLIIGLVLLAASGATVIARAAGRRRGRPRS
jgi:hypothetical protein